MPDTEVTFEQGLKAAAGAAWRTVLIAAILLTIGWGMFSVWMHVQPGWMLHVWGAPDLGWKHMQQIGIMVMASLKVVWTVGAFLTLFLVLWARRLRSQ